ncbi:MAG TPA: hypothetical protein VK176_00560 [Phycisphaerales bacterium]|nr:hypothetical protein [Phycisphaerales bacterium]
MPSRFTRHASIAALVLACGSLAWTTSVRATPSMADAPSYLSDDKKDDKTQDKLIMRNGTTLIGKIVSETATKVRFKGEVNGIALDTEYEKSEILQIVRGIPNPKATDSTAPAVPASAADPIKTPSPAATPDVTGKKRVYMLDLDGRFGRDISETPIRDALKDAQKQNADIILVKLNAEWKIQGQDAGDDATSFDELFRAEKIGPVISDEIERWERPPQVIVWVQKAMGGAAFLPFYSKNIYFTSEGRMGGIGALTQMLDGRGDQSFRDKQYSLRLAHARGVANKYGYPWQIINAMTVTEYVLSVSYVGSEVIFHERMPEGPGEELLTDDGKDDRVDTVKQIVGGDGNDNLTLNATTARNLKVSKGTADSVEELMTELGIARDWVEIKDAKAGTIMNRWSEGFQEAIRDIRTRIPQKMAEIPAGGNFQERSKARSQRKRLLKEMQDLFRKYREVFGEETADGEIARIGTQIELIDQEQQRDAQENRRR